MRYLLLTALFSISAYSQVPFPFNANSAGSGTAERLASFTVSGAGNDRLEITNDTDFDGQFAPTLWSYRDTDNRTVFSIKSSIPGALDNGSSPIMLFAASINNSPHFNAPATGDFPWGDAGTSQNIVNRPAFQWRNNSLRIMTMIANGNIGIGTITPTARLHNNGSVRFENLDNSTNPSFILGTDANGNVFEYNTSSGGSVSDADWLKPDGTVPYSISDDIYKSGRVGINVQNPIANLHLSGSVRFENLDNSTDPSFLLGTDSNGNVFEYNVPSVGSTSDSDWLKLDGTIPYSITDNIYNDGKVGIGINDLPTLVGTEDVSSYRLFVKGGLLTEEVRVALTSEWADYVFKKEYQLPTLKEVEKHIAEKGHLKDIPSEKEVKENGIELGEMNKLLLQKIEELTLYVIDLNKKVVEQKAQIDTLIKSKNEK